MVHRDTVIGIGGILLLMGIYAAAQTAGLGVGSLNGASRGVGYEVDMDGQLKAWGPRGPQAPATGACVEPACQEPFVDLNLTVTGLPDVGPELTYLVYLGVDEGDDAMYLGELEAAREGHRIDVNLTGQDGRSFTRLEILLAPSGEPPDPGHFLHVETVGPLEGDRPPPVDLSKTTIFEVLNRGWRCCGSSELSIEVTVVNPPPADGITRCAWLGSAPGVGERIGEDGTLIANATPSTSGFEPLACEPEELQVALTDEEVTGGDVLLVTLEQAEGAPPSEPSGFAMLQVDVLSRT